MNLNDGSLNYGSLTNSQGVQAGSVAHRRAWESGHIDYQGRDSFNNIQQQLEKNIAQQQPQYHPAQQRQTTPPQTSDANQQAGELAGAAIVKTTTTTTSTTNK